MSTASSSQTPRVNSRLAMRRPRAFVAFVAFAALARGASARVIVDVADVAVASHAARFAVTRVVVETGADAVDAARSRVDGDDRDGDAAAPDRAWTLKLCHCEFSTAASGLECAREGAIIAGFEASGEYAGRASGDEGLVPLSRAICCVPCLDGVVDTGAKIGDVFPRVTDDVDGDAAIGTLRAMSVDCVGTRSTTRDGRDVSCPAGTFLQGFKRVNKASSGSTAFYYPRDVGECCKVKFVLPSGEALGAESCACAPEQGVDVSCGGVNTARGTSENGAVITGFANAINAMGALGTPMRVPSTPLTCCKTCVSKDASPQPLSDGCSHLNFCSAHGDCVIDGHCECHVGWTGDDCGSVDDSADGMYGNAWQYGVMLSGVILGCCIRAMLCRHIEQVNLMRAQRFMMQEPVLRRATVNTTVMDEWEEASDLSTSDDDDDDDDRHDGDVELADAAAANDARDGDDSDANSSSGRDVVDNGEILPSSSVEVSEDEEGEPVLTKKSKEHSGVPDSECVVCMANAVQCVLIPCGHACMCRKCSRRMRRCPVCRVIVTRRQKLYMHNG